VSRIFLVPTNTSELSAKGHVAVPRFMSFVIEDWKSPYDLIRCMFGQFSGFSRSNRSTHVGIDKRLFHQRSRLGHSSSNQRAR